MTIVILPALVTATNGPSYNLSSHCAHGPSTRAGVEDIELLFLKSEVRAKEAWSRILVECRESAVKSSHEGLGCIWDVTGLNVNVLRWVTG